jgi:hypothetical protein
MPLSKIQTEVLRLLASHRDPESYVAGATPVNRDAPFSTTARNVSHPPLWTMRKHSKPRVTLSRDCGNCPTRLEWVADSDFRFFPTMLKTGAVP